MGVGGGGGGASIGGGGGAEKWMKAGGVVDWMVPVWIFLDGGEIASRNRKINHTSALHRRPTQSSCRHSWFASSLSEGAKEE